MIRRPPRSTLFPYTTLFPIFSIFLLSSLMVFLLFEMFSYVNSRGAVEASQIDCLHPIRCKPTKNGAKIVSLVSRVYMKRIPTTGAGTVRKAMYLMGALEDSDIEWLAANGTALRLSQGQVLVREGQPVDSLFVVLDGQLAVQAGGAHLATLLAGEVVGEISFVDSRPPLATATALDGARVLAVRREVLQTKLASDSKFAANFYRALPIFLADRLRATTTRK